MYRIRVCYDVKGWAYYRRAVALRKYAPADFEVTIGPDYGNAFLEQHHDLVLQLCFPYAKDLRRHLCDNNYNMLLISGYNVGLGYADGWFEDCRRSSDHVLINNRECWHGLGQPSNTTHISNGVDRDDFPLIVPIEKRKPRILWVGSHCHRVTKGYDEILLPLSQRLASRGIECDFRLVDSMGSTGYRSTAELAAWYNSGTIYVVASQTEGTPNPALEAASAGCIIVSTPVGNMPELITNGVNGEIVQRNSEALLDAILRCQSHYVQMAVAMQSTIERWHWKYRATEYFDLFRTLICEHRNGYNHRMKNGCVAVRLDGVLPAE